MIGSGLMTESKIDDTTEEYNTVPFEPEAVKAYLDGCIRYWRAHVGNPAAPYAHVSVDIFQSVRISLFGELLPAETGA